jgi:hypothetical protein
MLLCGLAAGALVWPSGLSARQWSVHVSAGRSVHELLAADVGTAHLNAEALYERGRRWGYAGGGLPLDAAASPWAGGGIGAAPVRSLGRHRGGIDLGAHGFAYRDRQLDESGVATVWEALPFLEFGSGSLVGRLRVGARALAVTQSGWWETRGVVHSDAFAFYHARPWLSIEGEARYVVGPDGSYPFAGAGVGLASGRAQAWARVGRWLAPGLDDAGWSSGVAYRIDARTTLRAEARHDPSDPLYWNAPRRTWAVGLTWWLGSAAAPLALPGAQADTMGPVRVVAGVVTIRVPAELSPDGLSVAADFTRWSPVAMTRHGADWVARFELAPGVYHFSLVDAQGRWLVPPGARTVPDGLGGANAVVVVP